MTSHKVYQYPEFLKPMTAELEERIKRVPHLDINTYVIPSPHIRHKNLEKDYKHSYVWDAQGEILGYMLVYSCKACDVYHVYNQATSPFGKGQGIGSSFIERLISDLPDRALVYLYIWEKQEDSIHFFRKRGFQLGERIVYRHQTFCLMEATAGEIRKQLILCAEKKRTERETLGKVRHDARKNLQLLLDMVNMLSVNNCTELIESINRECTSLVNLLNDYGDRIRPEHRINLRALIMERVIPFIEASSVPCEIDLRLASRIPLVLAHYIDVGRALINLVANSLDAIEEVGRKGVIKLSLSMADDSVVLKIRDNGVGMAPERLTLDPSTGLPRFVGVTTKGVDAGEGYGTRQVFAAFGPSNIEVTSVAGEFTEWQIFLQKSTVEKTTQLSELETRYLRLVESCGLTINEESGKDEIKAFISQTRDLELFCYDLIAQFSLHNNIRDIYRSVLAYRYAAKGDAFMESELDGCRVDDGELRGALMKTLNKVLLHDRLITAFASTEEFSGELFMSYGRRDHKTVIFTMDPESGRFFCCDRKLAEHLDFVTYLGRGRDELLRGELNGNGADPDDPIVLGVWTTRSHEDLIDKLKLIRSGAQKLVDIGFPPSKRLGFYNTTYNSLDEEIDSYKKTTLEDMAATTDAELEEFIVSADDELSGFVFAD